MSGLKRAGAGRYWLIWAAVVPVVLWAFVRGLGLERGFPSVALIAYTPYVAVLALFVAGVAVALRNWAAALLATIAAAWLLAAVLERLGVARLFPHVVISVATGESGGGVYSRFPLRQLAEARPFSFRMPRAEAVLPGHRPVRIVDVHPYTPKRASDGRWEKGLRSLPSSGPRGVPWILAGDFNATLDHAELRKVIDRGYRDAAGVSGEGLEPTWPIGEGLIPPPVTIDHVLADRRIGIADYEVLALPGSDHRAVYAQLALP